MTRAACPHEVDVVDAIVAGRYPSRVDAGLRAHVEACPTCADIAFVAPTLRDDCARDAIRFRLLRGARDAACHAARRSAATSATTRRTSLGRNGFSMTRRPLSRTNARSSDASVSPVTNTTRAARRGQFRSISR